MDKDDIVIAMNPTTFAKEQEFLVPGGVFFYADDIKAPIVRSDINAYPMPVKQLIRNSDVAPKLRDYIANMVYVGILAQSIGIDLDKINEALDFHFKGKKAAIESNFKVIRDSYDWAAENLVKRDPYRVEPMTAALGHILADGNSAAALGAVFGGVQFAAWYPITPASSLAESLHEFLPMFRKDPVTGKDTFVVVQAEDELAAIGMAIGAGWSGLRSMTSTSGPGFSLMAEYLGLAYYTETPVVMWDVQRVGPSTGLPTRTAQADIKFANFVGHGDTQFIVLYPGSVKECFEFGWQAFDLAERLQTPVLILSDLDLGMNQWMSEPFEYPDKPIDRGKVLWEKDLDAFLEKYGDWGRYLDVDGDGIPYRTIPGNTDPRSSYFTRGTGHDEFAKYSEEPEVWERTMARLKHKYESACDYVPAPVLQTMEGAEIGIIAVGSADAAITEARDILKVKGVPTDYLRVRALPFSRQVHDFIRNHERVYVVELNRDGQLKQLLTIEAPEVAAHLIQAAHMDGLPLTASWICDEIISKEVRNG
jgi:2-oxoglutarate ferredoxin oxidoreductase subunit alpha